MRFDAAVAIRPIRAGQILKHVIAYLGCPCPMVEVLRPTSARWLADDFRICGKTTQTDLLTNHTGTMTGTDCTEISLVLALTINVRRDTYSNSGRSSSCQDRGRTCLFLALQSRTSPQQQPHLRKISDQILSSTQRAEVTSCFNTQNRAHARLIADTLRPPRYRAESGKTRCCNLAVMPPR